jgi:CRP/FNR family transcriptional regulator, dissimilatory nitrate respiration regulator
VEPDEPTLSVRERLRAVPLFAALDDAALDELAALGRLLHLARKQVLLHEGEPYRGPFVVLSGLVVVYKLSADGRMLILQVCRPGDPLAVVPLFEAHDAGYPAHARTTRETDALFLPQEAFVPFLKRHPEVAWAFLGELAARLKEVTLQLEGVTLREVSSRLARYLLREVEASEAARESQPVLDLPLTKGSIASYLGTVHETLSRTFARLIREGVISVDGPKITILDKERLKKLV